MPKPKPTAVSEASTDRAPVIFSPNSSRTIPNDSGSTPPPAPCTTRATISQPMLGASAAISEPTASAARVITSIRVLPTTSPIRPSRGVAMLAESRYAVSTQVTVVWSVSSSCSMVASTGTISDCRSANDETETASTAKVSLRRPRTAGLTRRLSSAGLAGLANWLPNATSAAVYPTPGFRPERLHPQG